MLSSHRDLRTTRSGFVSHLQWPHELRDRDATAAAYRLANWHLLSDAEIPALESFRTTISEGPPATSAASVEASSHPESPERRCSSGWLAGRLREVRIEYTPLTTRASVEGIGVFEIREGGAAARILDLEVPGRDDRVAEALLGPVAALVLARRGVFLLHASAFVTGDRVAVFVGESGAGKSTLARPDDDVWERVADDILPVTLLEGRPVALTRFPQLKLLPSRACSLASTAALPLTAIYELEMSMAASTPCRFDRRSPGEAALAIARNTVAARVFDSDLLARHLDFCATVAPHVTVERFSYPRGLDRLGAIRATVLERFRTSAEEGDG